MPTASQKGPAQFSLEKYKEVENFGALEWAKQITYRLGIQSDINRAKSADDAATKRELSESVSTMIVDLIERPTYRGGKNYGYRIAVKKDAAGRMNTIFELDVDEVFRLHDELRSKGYSPLPPVEIRRFLPEQEQFDLLDQAEQPVDKIISHIHHGGFHPFAHLSVDLLARDDHIKANFSQWLSAYRESENKKRIIYTQKKLKQWHENRVLPYADLKLWADWTDNHLSDKDLMHLILSADKLGAEKPLKDTKRDYNTVMLESTVSILFSGSDQHPLPI